MLEAFLFAVNSGLIIAASSVLVPSAVLFTECGAACIGRSHPEASVSNSHPGRVAVLMPAHNEALVIRPTLEAILSQLSAEDRLVVVADNCEDETAAIARSTGATVIERQDREHRGKGYALDYGLEFLAADPPDIVIFMDADCDLQPGTLAALAQQAIATGRPVQSQYLFEKPNQPSAKDAVSAFACKVKNGVRSLGLARLGQPCLLAGTGMAFPWQAIRSVELASGNIVEDMKLGLDLAIAGYSPVFCPRAKVTSRLPQQQDAAMSQRTRWEHGHIQTLLTYGPKLLLAAMEQRRGDLVAIALDLCVPPLSLLVLLWVALTAGVAIAGLLGASWIPAILAGIAGFCLLTGILAAWLKFGRDDLPARTLLTIPFYILWKIPLYLKFLVKPQAQWVRTERDVVDS